MEIFLCTFLIKLQYVKRGKESNIRKGASPTFQALLKSSKNYIIASGNSKPILMNDTAWFNQKFEISSDLLFNPDTKTYNQSLITLQIKTLSKYSNQSYSKSFNLAEVAEKNIISERQYSLNGGLIASIELSCSHIESKGIIPLRKKEKSLEKGEKEEGSNSFLMVEKVSFAGSVQKETGRDTPQFRESSFKQIEESIDNHPLDLEDTSNQLGALREQFNKELQEHEQTKGKLRIVKQQLEKEYNVNREHKIAISTLQKQLQKHKESFTSLENHLSETENLCTALSATLNNKQTEIIDLYSIIDQHKQKMGKLAKRLEVIEPLERAKAQLEWEIGVLKKQIENLKMIINKQYLLQNEMQVEIQQLKAQNLKSKNLKEKSEEELNKTIKREKQNSALIAKLTQQKDSIKRQTSKWRSQFAAQSQQKDEEINNLQQHYNKLFHRYEEMAKKVEGCQIMISKEIFDSSVKNYEKKLQQKEEKQLKLREQLDIIQEQIVNLQSALEQKEENQQILLEHIKKLQKEIDQYAITDNWWASVFDKNQSAENNQNGSNDEKSKLLNKNQHLIQLLQKNSKAILEGQKIKLELASLKKQNEQLFQKDQLLNQQHKQMKQKIAALYKQNKKLQEKNSKLMKENELINKKNMWLEEEITQSKLTQKQARQDYQIVSYHLYKMEAANQRKQQQQKEKSTIFLSVINENSQQFLASSHQLIRQSSTKQKPKIENNQAILEQLVKLLEERATDAEEMHSHLQNLQPQNLNNSVEEIKKQLKKVSLSTSKIKTVLVKSGNKEYVRQWETAISSLSNALQHFIIYN